jgi:subtilase family serine protease
MNLKRIVGLGVLFVLLAVLGIPLAFSEQLPTLVTAASFPAKTFAKYSSIGRIKGIIDDNDTVVLRGNVHPLALPKYDIGAANPSMPAKQMMLSLRLTPEKQAALDRLLAEQHDPVSPNFHHWLTPEEVGERFGPPLEDINKITNWLTSHGFTVDHVAKSHTWIYFSGDVSKIENTFQTKIRKYNVKGKLRYANDREPSIPRALAGLVSGRISLNSFPWVPANTGARSVPLGPVQPDGIDPTNGTLYLTPADFATIYNVNPLYSEGIDGSGVNIAIVGRTNPSNASVNWANFRTQMGLPVPTNPPQVLTPNGNPGDLGSDEDTEADLDVEWAGAIAKNANIFFVASPSTIISEQGGVDVLIAMDGIDTSAHYIVENMVPPAVPAAQAVTIMSTSFISCAGSDPLDGLNFSSLWQQAALEGITSFVASGDYGPLCNVDAGTITNSTQGVNAIASTPYNVAVGGSEFNWDSSNMSSYWNTSSGSAGYGSAISYIPENAWNDDYGTSGGGASGYSQPSWQKAPGVPTGTYRYVPDVSLSASPQFAPYGIYTSGDFKTVGGTSAAAPSFAGIMALIVQKNGGIGQGNANTILYPLANAQYGTGGAMVFHDITQGNNNFHIDGSIFNGSTCTAGYDPVTGLGSVDAYVLANNWTVPPGQTYQLTVTISDKGYAAGSVTPNSGIFTWNGTTGTENYFSSTYVTLTATPNPGSVFTGWSGCNSVSGQQCNVTLNANTSITAFFAPVITPVINYLLHN